MIGFVEFLILIFAVYGLTETALYHAGPFGICRFIRTTWDKEVEAEGWLQKSVRWLTPNFIGDELNQGVNCPYCLSVYTGVGSVAAWVYMQNYAEPLVADMIFTVVAGFALRGIFVILETSVLTTVLFGGNRPLAIHVLGVQRQDNTQAIQNNLTSLTKRVELLEQSPSSQPETEKRIVYKKKR